MHNGMGSQLSAKLAQRSSWSRSSSIVRGSSCGLKLLTRAAVKFHRPIVQLRERHLLGSLLFYTTTLRQAVAKDVP